MSESYIIFYNFSFFFNTHLIFSIKRHLYSSNHDLGFDGVEIHAAHSHSYIVHQHLKKTSTNNQTQVPKTDPVVPITNYLIQVIQAIVDTIGPGKVGVRLFSPAMDAYEGTVCDPLSLGLSVISELNKLQTKIDTKLAFLHFTRPRLTDQRVSKTLRVAYEGTFLSSGGYDKEQGMESVAQGDADLIAYGRYFVANPDLVDRFKVGAFMNKYERDTFYTHDPVVGYTDYPSLQQITSLETMST